MSIFLRTGRVKAEWTDYNSHMNLAYYIHLFDLAWEILLEKFNMGEESSINQRKSTFAVESHTTYNQEVKVGEEMLLSTFKPTHGKFGYLEGVLKSLNLNVGDIIYTSGVSTIYPSDLPVAKINSIKNNPNKLYQDVIVEILSDIDNLNYVFIIQ